MRRLGRHHITIVAVVGNDVEFTVTCLECGGYEQTLRGDGSLMSMVHCSACGVWLGRLSAVRVQAARIAQGQGHPIDLRAYIAR